jgi:translation elongation factor EF-1alpha
VRHDVDMSQPETEPFRFRVRDSLSISGRGTTVIGYIEAGAIRPGDALLLHTRRVVCKGVSSVREVGWSPGDAVAVALLIPEIDPADVGAGDHLIGDAS